MIRYTRSFSVAVLACFLPAIANGAIVLLEDFEDNTVTYTGVTEFFDTSNDFFTIVPLNGSANPDDGPYTGFGGSNFFAAEDMNDPEGPGLSTQTLQFNVDITNFTGLTFSGLFAAGGNSTGGSDAIIRYDAADGLRVRATIDGGTTQNLLAFEALEPAGDQNNNELRQDADFNGIGDPGGFLPTGTFAAFNGIAIAGTGSNLLLEIEVSVDANNEELAFDNIRIDGTFNPAMTPVPEPYSFAIWSLLALVVGGLSWHRRKRQAA